MALRISNASLARTGTIVELFSVGGGHTTKITHYDGYSASVGGTPTHVFLLPASDEYCLEEAKKAKELVIGRYYRPRARNFATADSLFLIQPSNSPPILLVFQFTLNRTEHDVNVDGLNDIKALAPDGTLVYYVAITLSNLRSTIKTPVSHFGPAPPTPPDAEFPMFQFPIGDRTLFLRGPNQ